MRTVVIAAVMILGCDKSKPDGTIQPSVSPTTAASPIGKAAAQPPRPSAESVCKLIESAGVGANCAEKKPGGLGAAAVERFEFDLPSVPGKGGSVLRFDRESFYANTEEAYGNAAVLAGPHRYGSKKALIFVQANEGLSLEDGKKLKAIIDGL